MRTDVFTMPDPRTFGNHSCETNFGRYVCYRHLQGDMMYVAEDVINGGKREFFGSAEELRVWVEAQPRSTMMARREGYYTWKVAF